MTNIFFLLLRRKVRGNSGGKKDRRKVEGRGEKQEKNTEERKKNK
jgi:hypothetical protein